jgi:hypothetical protein
VNVLSAFFNEVTCRDLCAAKGGVPAPR